MSEQPEAELEEVEALEVHPDLAVEVDHEDADLSGEDEVEQADVELPDQPVDESEAPE